MIRYHLESFLESNEALVRCLLNSTYVDDIITGADTEEAAFDLSTPSRRIRSIEVDSISANS